MNTESFLVIYFILLVLTAVCEILILSNDKYKYLKLSYKPLMYICENFCAETSEFNSENLSYEINRFYNECLQEMPQLKKFYPNVVIWIDAIIFRIDIDNKKASVLKQYAYNLKVARDTLEQKNPFNKCEKYQQGILCDMIKMKTPENEILVQNIIDRTEEEFLKLSGDIKKNNRLNIVSIAIGSLGILVSILMAMLKF